LVLRAKLARARLLRLEQGAGAAEEADIVEGGEAVAGAELAIGGPAGGDALAQRGLVGRQAVGAAVGRQALVAVLAARAEDQPGALGQPQVGEAVQRAVVLFAGASAEAVAVVIVPPLQVHSVGDIVRATKRVEAQLASRLEGPDLDFHILVEPGKLSRVVLDAVRDVARPFMAA